MEDRASQEKPDILGGGLLGEEQFDVALLLDQVIDLKEGKPPTRIQACDLDLFSSQDTAFNISICQVGVESIADFQEFILHESSIFDTQRLKTCWDSAVKSTYYQARHYIHPTSGKMHDINRAFVDSLEKLPNPSFSPALRRLSGVIPLFLGRNNASDYPFQCRMAGDKYINPPEGKTPILTIKGDSRDCRLIFGRKLVWMKIGHDNSLLTLDQWVMFHNKIVEIWLVLTYAYLSEGIQYTQGFSSRILQLLKICRKLVQKYGNRAYDFHGLLEGFLTGSVIAREEKWSNNELRDIMWSSICDLKLGFKGDLFDSDLYKLTQECSTPELIDLCGTTKLTGHPAIQTQMGLKKLYDRTHKDIPISYESVIEVINTIKQDFCQRFLLKHHKWPQVEISPGCPEIMLRAIMTNKWMNDPELVRQYGQEIDLDSWNFIELGQVMEFDWVESQMPFLKDRALAPRYSQLTMDQASRMHIPMSDRRVLLRFLLTRNVFDLTEKYLDSYQKDPISVLDYLVIKLTQKEKELKIGGRMFGQSPYEERFRRCIMEHNVARLMVDYDPYQSMTTNELQKLSKLLMFRTLRHQAPGYRVFQYSIDAEAWNNYFRPEFVNAIGKSVFDKLLGVSLYEHTMDTYCLSYIYGLHKGERIGWEGQLGGIEGLSQKVWTWIYSRVALRVLESLGYKGYIMVCGDDLRVAVLFPEELFHDREEAEVAMDFKDRLKAAFERYGFRMKVTETVTSETFIAYGRVYQVGDSFMPSVLKKIAKIHGFQGTTFPLIEQQIASVFSNAHAACQTTTSHVVIHLLAGFVTALRLQGKTSGDLSRVEMIELLCRPSVLGGLPILHLCHFMVRGESDHLTIAISFAIFLMTHGIDIALGWSLITTPLELTNRKRNFKQLLIDPYCLPISKPEAATAFLKRVMEQHIRRIVKNKAMKSVLRTFSPSKERQFIACLASMDPCLAKVLSVLWECSPFNILSEVIQKFESSRSIFQLLCVNRRRRGLYKILEAARSRERKYIQWLRQLVRRPLEESTDIFGMSYEEFMQQEDAVHIQYPICPTRYTQMIRDCAWQRPVLTITYPCMSDFLTIFSADDIVPFNYLTDHIVSNLYGTDDPAENHHFAEGNKKAWIGTTTSEKLLMPKASLDFEGSVSVKISKILKLLEFIRSSGPDAMAVLEWVLEKVSGHQVGHFLPFVPGRTGGTISHRLRTKTFKETIMSNELPNRSQLISIHHDSHAALQSQVGDFSVNYMAMLLHHMTLILFPLEMTSRIDFHRYGRKFFSQVTVKCPDCFYDVSDTHIVTMTEDLPDMEPLPDDNKLVGYTEVLQRELVRQCQQVGLPNRHNVFLSEQGAEDITLDTAHNLLASALIRESFGGNQEAYQLGISTEYQADVLRMEALYNKNPRTKLSIREWKTVSGMSLASALIQETHAWILHNPLMRSNAESDILDMPPQLNPFMSIAYHLISARRVLHLNEGFKELGYATRPLVAQDLTGTERCAAWILATAYPIASLMLKSHVLDTRMMNYFSYESDELIVTRVNRLLTYASISYYQNLMRIFLAVSILEVPMMDALNARTASATRIRRKIQTDVERRPHLLPGYLRILHQSYRYVLSVLEINGVHDPVDTIPFGTSLYFSTGNLEEPNMNDFMEVFISRIQEWPVPWRIVDDVWALEELPDETVFQYTEAFDWPVLRIERYGLYAAVSRVREEFAEQEERAITPPAVGIPITIEYIMNRERRVNIRDIRDLHEESTNTGSEAIVHQIIERIGDLPEPIPLAVPFSHFSRINGHSITSVVKLHEIFLRVGLLAPMTRRAPGDFWGMCLADGEGGFTNYLLGLNRRMHVIFNTMFIPSMDSSVLQSTPSEVLLSADYDRIHRCKSEHNYTGYNDLTLVQTITNLERLCFQYTQGVGATIITFDAEGTHLDEDDTYYRLMRNVMSLSLRCISTDGVCIIKTFLSRSTRLWALIQLFCDIFQFVRLIKPDTSHSSNGEFYIVVANPAITRENRISLAQRILLDYIYGPANADILTEATDVITTIANRRLRVEEGTENPVRWLTWAICNWNDIRLPQFTWGIIHRRLSLIAPRALIDPVTKQIVWNEDTVPTVLRICQQAAMDTQQTLESGQSSILPLTTYTHLCHRLARWIRQRAFLKGLLSFEDQVRYVSHDWVGRVIQDVLDEVQPNVLRYSQDGTLTDGYINKEMENLRVNVWKEIKDGVSLSMRFLAAETCHKYYQTHNAPPAYPFEGQYSEDWAERDMI